MANNSLDLFLGCMIQYRLPLIEKGIRSVLAKLDVPFEDIPQYSCCPEPNGIKNSNYYLHALTASRNLALSEKRNHNILAACNGCFETLKGVRSEVGIDPVLQQKINADLERIGLRFTGKTDVFHIVEYFARKVGTGTIRDQVVNPLRDLRVAVHYGCHFLRPSHRIQTDNPLDPHIFDELVEALGSLSVPYDDKMLCCGGSLDRAGNATAGLDIVKTKLEKMKQAGVDCIVTCCPQCFLQFDVGQDSLKKVDMEFNLPVFYFTELLGIALGLSPEELGLEEHRIPVESVFEKLNRRKQAMQQIKEEFDEEFLEKCYECAACEHDCPPARFSNFSPREFVGKLLAGQLEEVIADDRIWSCLDCYLCYELCPSKMGLVDVFTKLRNLARKTGHIPQGFKNEFESFEKTGLVAKYAVARRKKLGLPVFRPELDDLVKMFTQPKSKKQGKGKVVP
ncbi:MAG: heterodisulfide reductase, B/C subunit [Promethearchaeota archaeon CR_4]|nr:MAG: heterodisulfide reductase, B/C subunit [Candidatus Lokiarchaeota archaeon CR_4]